jgi:hypothetical protein
MLAVLLVCQEECLTIYDARSLLQPQYDRLMQVGTPMTANNYERTSPTTKMLWQPNSPKSMGSI